MLVKIMDNDGILNTYLGLLFWILLLLNCWVIPFASTGWGFLIKTKPVWIVF